MSRTTPEPPPSEGTGLVFDDPLAQQSPDDSDEGWGGSRGDGHASDDLARFLQEKPPHHL